MGFTAHFWVVCPDIIHYLSGCKYPSMRRNFRGSNCNTFGPGGQRCIKTPFTVIYVCVESTWLCNFLSCLCIYVQMILTQIEQWHVNMYWQNSHQNLSPGEQCAWLSPITFCSLDKVNCYMFKYFLTILPLTGHNELVSMPANLTPICAMTVPHNELVLSKITSNLTQCYLAKYSQLQHKPCLNLLHNVRAR